MSEAVEKMMLLRGAMARRLCRISLRSYSTAIEMTPHSSEAANSERVKTDNDVRDVTRYMSAREANKSRTRARVQGQLKGFLASREITLSTKNNMYNSDFQNLMIYGTRVLPGRHIGC